MSLTFRIGHSPAFMMLSLGLLLPLAGLGSNAAAVEANETTAARQKCDGVSQDRAACLREIGAAKQERRTDGLSDPAPKEQQQNATARCAEQPAVAQADCQARMKDGSSTKSEGSVSGGGIIRETVTPASAPR